jgi:hypothetical protein
MGLNNSSQPQAARANEARIILNYTYTGGTKTAAVAGNQGCPICRDTVELTGGYYTSLDNASESFATVDHRSQSSYLIGFTPSAPPRQGKYHNLKVSVSRPGVTVRFQQGYYAEGDLDPVRLKTAVIKARVEGALAYDSPAEDIPVAVTAEPPSDPAGRPFA